MTEWHKITEVEPEDHEWVLIAHPAYDTPMKALFHIGEGFSFGKGATENEFIYLFDNLVTYWTELPEMPEDYRKTGVKI